MSKALPPIKPVSTRGHDAYGSPVRYQSAPQAPLLSTDSHREQTPRTAGSRVVPGGRDPCEVEFTLGPVQERHMPPYNDLEDPHLAPYWARREMLIYELVERRRELRRRRRVEMQQREAARRRFKRRRQRELEELSARKGYASQRRAGEDEEPQWQTRRNKTQPHPPASRRLPDANARPPRRQYEPSGSNSLPTAAAAPAADNRNRPMQRKSSGKAASRDLSARTAVNRNASKEKSGGTTKPAKPKTEETKIAERKEAPAASSEPPKETAAQKYKKEPDTPLDSTDLSTEKELDREDTKKDEAGKQQPDKKDDVKSNSSGSSTTPSSSSPSSSRSTRDRKMMALARSNKAAKPLSSVDAVPAASTEPKAQEKEYPVDDDFESSTASSTTQEAAKPLSSVNVVPAASTVPKAQEKEYPVDDDFESSTASSTTQEAAKPLSSVNVVPAASTEPKAQEKEYPVDDDFESSTASSTTQEAAKPLSSVDAVPAASPGAGEINALSRSSFSNSRNSSRLNIPEIAKSDVVNSDRSVEEVHEL